MDSLTRTIITDIKAAARIGHAESLWVALDGLLDLPQVSGNPPLNEAFIAKVILPIGETLANPRVNTALVYPLLDEAQAAIRACAASALAYRFFQGDQLTVKDLGKPGKDSRQDVRLALKDSLAVAGLNHPDKLDRLAAKWLTSPSPRLQAIAISLLPNLPDKALDSLAEFHTPSDPEVRAALVDALTTLAQAGQAEGVFNLLTDWSKNQDNNIWAICKTLSGSWAAEYPQQAMEILKTLLPKAEKPKQLINTLQALYRHGAEQQVLSTLKTWQQVKDPSLQELSKRVLKKLET